MDEINQEPKIVWADKGTVGVDGLSFDDFTLDQAAEFVAMGGSCDVFKNHDDIFKNEVKLKASDLIITYDRMRKKHSIKESDEINLKQRQKEGQYERDLFKRLAEERNKIFTKDPLIQGQGLDVLDTIGQEQDISEGKDVPEYNVNVCMLDNSFNFVVSTREEAIIQLHNIRRNGYEHTVDNDITWYSPTLITIVKIYET